MYEVKYLTMDKHSQFIIFAFNCGSSNEQEDNNGVFHLLEHLILSDYNINKELHNVYLDAITTKEWTYFLFITKSENEIIKKINYIIDTLFSLKITNESLDNEKKIICDEIKNRGYFSNFKQLFNRLMFNGTSYALPTTGKSETVINLNIKRVQNIYNKYYDFNQNFRVYCSSEDICTELSNKLSKIEKRIEFNNKLGVIKHSIRPISKSINKKGNEFNLSVATIYTHMSDYDAQLLDLLGNCLFGAKGLFVSKLKKDCGIYNIQYIYDVYKDFSLFGFGISTNRSNYDRIILCLKELINEIHDNSNMLNSIYNDVLFTKSLEVQYYKNNIFDLIRLVNEMKIDLDITKLPNIEVQINELYNYIFFKSNWFGLSIGDNINVEDFLDKIDIKNKV
ncbi:M16 family metallopeptidase [Inconstantimicrobium porci]|nr:insulinase family protein [Inconstantimicrobium porci]